MTDHPLTDEMIDVLWGKTKDSIIDWDEPLDSQVIRAAYDLGESKGRAGMLEEVIDWIEATLDAGDLIAEGIKEEMRPQGNNQ